MMADKEYSRYQQKVIQRYYDNREQIDEQRLSELVTSLFLASPAKQKKLWQTAEELLTRMKVPASRIEHIIQSGDPTVLARVVEDVQKGILKRSK